MAFTVKRLQSSLHECKFKTEINGKSDIFAIMVIFPLNILCFHNIIIIFNQGRNQVFAKGVRLENRKFL